MACTWSVGCWELFLQDATKRVVVYIVYCHSKARSSAIERRQAHSLLLDVCEDAVGRGDVPFIIAGDMNLEEEESHELQQWARSQWHNARHLGNAEHRYRHTCVVGSGSYIDHIWFSPPRQITAYWNPFGPFPQ
eukprot:6479212-Amphidinium_carterae.1